MDKHADKTGFLSATEYESIDADSQEVMRLIRSSILTKKKRLGTKIVSILLFVLLIFNLI